ncbi:glycoside hydrolase family 2 TIM barrel-domain containing protein [Saccharibacillus sp. CPCC 101409]|uniref:glycoside hydrolase family 2 protein n=1 Tax=Saccharibacillus sp. CPCC 101409 TaxID=3058041 RepID=UPI0026733035|nr:glycoside hydrolase family 2 TIM barrel-domain containing protein [Saccharibacillus sp. CPCC 101409]MDO3412538.1 glycoside hydrolase family 2 TIM barrel-domain containing protein [Saccharibacillus sp. CPCC 101409]
MIRLFDTHAIRPVRELDGLWDFQPVGRAGEMPQQFEYRLPVPGCWETHPDLGTYRGTGLYRRTINVNRRTNLRLEFKGVSHTADVYFDGRPIAHHYNAYTAFEAVIRDVEPGEHEIALYADNSFGEHSALHIPNDYYTYGGPIRPVVLEEIEDVFIERVSFRPEWANGTWSGRWRAVVRNIGEHAAAVGLRLGLDGLHTAREECRIEPGQSSVVERTEIYDTAEEWSPERPALYTIRAELIREQERAGDDWIDRIGFRRIETAGEEIRLNGRRVVFKGVNRHEDHARSGAALSFSEMLHDIELIRDLGCNTVRTSHYPNDERFLDLCDEFGLLVWEENHARGLSEEQMRNPNFRKQSEDVTREMVEQHGNRPSIVIWAVLNECASDTEYGREIYKEELELIRSLDPSRPRTFATHNRERDLCLDLADIVSFNLYPGWYTDEDPGELMRRARGWADRLGGAGRPMIISEFGADGYYGFRSRERVKGSEERQCDILDDNLSAYLADESLSGVLVWQFGDCRVSEDNGWLLSRGCTRNSKGLVDGYRRPKAAYDTVRRHFRGEADIPSAGRNARAE